jgi:hypothetical protein
MSGFFWAVLGFIGTFCMTAIGDIVSEEVRDRLDHLPHAILALAAKRLDPAQRDTLYQEVWLPDLAYYLRGDEARPVTRLYHGLGFALGMLASAGRSSRNLDQPVTQSDIQVIRDDDALPNAVLPWRKSSTTTDSRDCIEVAITKDAVFVRYAQDPRGSILRFTVSEWRAFLAGARRGRFDLPGGS